MDTPSGELSSVAEHIEYFPTNWIRLEAVLSNEGRDEGNAVRGI